MTQQTATRTHARITDDGAPELITWQEFCDEIEAAKKGVRRRTVRTVSGDDNGRTYYIAYADGRRVTLRQATDADQPAPAAGLEQMWATARSTVDLYHAMDADNRARCNRGIWGYLRDRRDGLKTRAQVEEIQKQYDFIKFCPKCLAKTEAK